MPETASDFHHIPGRTVSPCLNCKDRKTGYACLRNCNLPGRYSVSLGIMGCSVPAEMTPQGRNLRFLQQLAPGYSPVHSAPRKGENQAPSYHRSRSGGHRYRQVQRCHFYGCIDESHGAYCKRHYRIIYMRIICMKWPVGFAYAPTGGGRSILPELRQKESAGLLAEVEWYKASLLDHAAGLMDISKYRRKE